VTPPEVAVPAANAASPAPAPGTTVTTPVRRVARIAVLGASGYSGVEFARLALGHPGLPLAVLCSREYAGQPAGAVLPGLDPRVHALPPIADPSDLSRLAEQGVFDTLVSCLPHGALRELFVQQPALKTLPARIVDLSGDHRDGSEGFRYGLPEAFRLELEGAARVANPGCYPTAATLALLPALEHGWIGDPVMVSALSGVSGAGRAPALRTSFVELEGGASIYRAGTEHNHVAEMARNFGRLARTEMAVGFTPQLAPMARGILLTATAPLTEAVTPAQVFEAYTARFEREPFVHMIEPGSWPETRSVRSSNRCDIAVTTLHGGRTLLATAALDNLVKGAAGQAVQNLNLMLGWPEDWGLPRHGSPW
jgi:N-acetyl-gamma-glutamyl-phosphate reductase